MKQVELSKNLKLGNLLKRIPKEEIVITQKGHAVALLSEFDDDDLEWYERERDPAFIEALKRVRRQEKRGQVISHEDLKQKLGIDEPFETYLWKEVERLLADGKNGEKAWPRLKRRCLEVLAKTDRLVFEPKFTPERCAIRYEKISPASLKALLVKEQANHDQQISTSTDEPLVIVEFRRKKILVDGKRRRFVWLKEKAPGPFPAIIVRCNPR